MPLNETERDSVKYLVIQSGTALRENMNIGLYKETWLNESIYLSRTYGLINKEHNGDYLKTDLIHKKFDHGLDTINIAPEFGQMQTKIYWNNLNSKERSKFYKLCLDSGRWKK